MQAFIKILCFTLCFESFIALKLWRLDLQKSDEYKSKIMTSHLDFRDEFCSSYQKRIEILVRHYDKWTSICHLEDFSKAQPERYWILQLRSPLKVPFFDTLYFPIIRKFKT